MFRATSHANQDNSTGIGSTQLSGANIKAINEITKKRYGSLIFINQNDAISQEDNVSALQSKDKKENTETSNHYASKEEAVNAHATLISSVFGAKISKDIDDANDYHRKIDRRVGI